MYLELRFGVFVFAQGPLGMREPLLCNHGKNSKWTARCFPFSDNVKYNSEKIDSYRTSLTQLNSLLKLMIVGFLISILLELFYKSTSGHTALRPQVETQLYLFDNRSNWLSYCIWFYCSGLFQEIFPGLLQGSQPSGRGSTWIAGGPVHGRGTQARMVPSGRSVTENFKSWKVNIGSFMIWLVEINSLMLPLFISVTSFFSRAKSS